MLRVEERDDLSVFDELAGWWNSQPGPQRSVFMRTEWFKTLATHVLEPAGRLHVLVFRDGEDPVAAVPMFRSGRLLRSLTELATEEYDVVMGDDPELAGHVIAELARRPAVRFEALEDESPLTRAVASERRWFIDYRTRSGYVDLGGGMEPVAQHIGKGQRSNLRRGLRHLEKVGDVRVVPHPTPDQVLDVMESGFDMEHAGWKGEEGSSVRSSPRRLAFFRNLARVAEERGWLRLGAMYAGDRMVAFNYDLEYAGRLVGILTSYDETLNPRCSAGHVLLWRTLEVCVDRGVIAYDLGSVGGHNAWKLRWAARTSPRLYVTGFGSGPAGRAEHAVWRAKRVLRRFLP